MLAALTIFHVLLSLVGIVAGIVAVAGFIRGTFTAGWNKVFLWTTIATSATGYLFPFHQLLPSHIVGAISLVVLALTVVALYRFKLAGVWGRVYAATSAVALYFNVFVLVVQLFLKVPPLHALAPTQAEPPFAVAQGAVLIAFLAFGSVATKRFKA